MIPQDPNDPRSLGEGPCTHQTAVTDQAETVRNEHWGGNSAARWVDCGKCGLRLATWPKIGFTGRFTGEPSPRFVRNALQLLKGVDSGTKLDHVVVKNLIEELRLKKDTQEIRYRMKQSERHCDTQSPTTRASARLPIAAETAPRDAGAPQPGATSGPGGLDATGQQLPQAQPEDNGQRAPQPSTPPLPPEPDYYPDARLSQQVEDYIWQVYQTAQVAAISSSWRLFIYKECAWALQLLQSRLTLRQLLNVSAKINGSVQKAHLAMSAFPDGTLHGDDAGVTAGTRTPPRTINYDECAQDPRVKSRK